MPLNECTISYISHEQDMVEFCCEVISKSKQLGKLRFFMSEGPGWLNELGSWIT